jgi:hypothetical protein
MKRNAYRLLVGKSEGKRPLERRRRRWEDNIKIDLRDIEWGSMDLIHLSQNRDRWRAVVKTVTNLWVPKKLFRNYSISERLAASQEGLSHIELVS